MVTLTRTTQADIADKWTSATASPYLWGPGGCSPGGSTHGTAVQVEPYKPVLKAPVVSCNQAPKYYAVLCPERERRVSVYEEAPGFRLGPRDDSFQVLLSISIAALQHGSPDSDAVSGVTLSHDGTLAPGEEITLTLAAGTDTRPLLSST